MRGAPAWAAFMGIVGVLLAAHGGALSAGRPEGAGWVTSVRSVQVLADRGGRVAWSRDGSLIAFDRRNADGWFDVYLVRPDGSGLRSLTEGGKGLPQFNNGNPAWHPSGDWIAFQAQDPDLSGLPRGLLGRYAASPGIGVNNNIWLAAADGSGFYQLTRVKERHGILHPQFSPDGRLLAWSELIGPAAGGIGRWAIRLADFAADAAGPRVSNVRTLRPLDLQLYETHGFSPDGRGLVFSGVPEGKFYYDMEIFVLDLSTGQAVRLTDNGAWDEHAHFSPDGRHIVWASSEGIPQERSRTWAELAEHPPLLDYWIMDADGSNKRRLSGFNEPGAKEQAAFGGGVIAADFDWSPDGSAIVARLQQGRRDRAVIIELDLPRAPASAGPAAAGYKSGPGPYEVAVARYEWQDAKRQRPVAAKVYYPAGGSGPFPVVVFSHGAGGSREGYEYLGRHWASHGYVSVHLDHEGSDEAVWRGQPDPLAGIRRAVADPRNAINRPLDVSFALDRMEELNRTDPPLQGRLDLARIGVAGHSFGAFTTLAVAGQTFVLPAGREASFRDPRVIAAIAMSAPVPRKRAPFARAFGSISIPCMHMTGMRDDSPIGDTKAEERRIPFDNIHAADQYLVTFVDGDHMIFSGRGRLPGGARDPLFQELIKTGTLAFWDAYLLGNSEAKAWLTQGGFAAALGPNGRLEMKVKQPLQSASLQRGDPHEASEP